MGEDVRDFVLEIYDTVVDPQRWPGVLDRCAEMVDGLGCIVFEMDGHGPDRKLTAPLHSSKYDPELLTGYIKYFRDFELVDQDVFEAHSLAADGIDLIDDAVLAPSIEELKRRPNVRQLMEYGICHRAAGLLNKDNRQRSRFSVQLGTARGPLTAEENARLSVYLPHIAKALDLGRPAKQLTDLQRSVVAAMDSLKIGVCIMDRTGSVIVTNTEFERQRAEYGAFRIDPAGRLHLHEGADQARYASLLEDALAHGHHGARPRKEAIPTNTDGKTGALSIELVPLERFAEMGSAPLHGAVLYSLDTAQITTCDPVHMMRVFGLTQAESELTPLIFEGLTNAQIAQQRGRSVDTVNAQVKSILTKTHCANRTQLARVLSGFGMDFLQE